MVLGLVLSTNMPNNKKQEDTFRSCVGVFFYHGYWICQQYHPSSLKKILKLTNLSVLKKSNRAYTNVGFIILDMSDHVELNVP